MKKKDFQNIFFKEKILNSEVYIKLKIKKQNTIKFRNKSSILI
jgi:hypothetical protein